MVILCTCLSENQRRLAVYINNMLADGHTKDFVFVAFYVCFHCSVRLQQSIGVCFLVFVYTRGFSENSPQQNPL